MSSKDQPHLYGSADDRNRQPPAEEGLRGEGDPKGPMAKGQTRPVGGDTDAVIEEQSGTAFAETKGARSTSDGA